ncbi:MAG: PhzF family phenazine biosynthesis protein [Legionellaceae bacterium]|nr:PhzF family phenazine biosynthesis protein [Legionellaceae bacterium]
MQDIEIFQVDAFTDKVFHGNPAAVCLLTEWLNDELMQAIAAENNLSETAFIVQHSDGYHIRWFAPNGEISLCGHATLAAGFVLFELNKVEQDRIDFSSLSGTISVLRHGSLVELDFPKVAYRPLPLNHLPELLVDQAVMEAWDSDLDCVLVLGSELEVAKAQVNLKALINMETRGLILTAAASDVDFYSRCFYPRHNIAEDPVTGSAHCILTPLWADKLQKKELQAIQGSVRRGYLQCRVAADRVYLSGACRWFLKGHLVI